MIGECLTMKNKKILMLLLAAALLIGLLPASAAADPVEPYEYVEEASSGNAATESFTVRTPSDEPCTLYVSGTVTAETKALSIGVVNVSGTFLRVFAFPDENGEFSFSVNTSVGNTAFPTAIKGTVLTDEKGGQTNRRNYSTKPGYAAVSEAEDDFYRITIAKAVTDHQVDGIFDEDSDYSWHKASNPLSGGQGFTCKEFVLAFEDNSPHLIRYPDVIANNAAVRSADSPLTPGTPAWDEYTDPYLRDFEWVMFDDGTDYPVTDEQIELFEQVAAEITAGADSDYEKALRIYEFISDSFYYDNYAYNNGIHSCCNPYLNLMALRMQTTGVNCINGKVATVCNGFASLVCALCRASGIPARVVNGCHAAGMKKVWGNLGKDHHTAVTHWWSEAYIDGRWVVIDATVGCGSSWERSDWTVADDDAWRKAACINYAGFDNSPDALATTHYYINIHCASLYHRDYPSPENLQADTSTGYVRLSWEAVPGANYYYVYRGADLGSVKYYTYVRGEDTTSWISLDDLEEVGHTYYYRVSAKVGDVVGTRSKTVSACVSEEERAGALQPPVIDEQPVSLTAEIGAEASFSVAAHNGTLSYAWQYYSVQNDAWYTPTSAAYSGLDTPTMTVTATQARDGMRFRCKVSNELFSVYTDEVTLHAESRPPVVTSQPLSASGRENEQVSFTVGASGSNLKYKWQYFDPGTQTWKNVYGDYYSGADTPTLTVTVRPAYDGRLYRCRITNASGSADSEAAVLTLRPQITSQPKSTSAYCGENVTFTVKASGSGLSYQWQYRKTPTGAWYTSGASGAKTSSMTVEATAARSGFQFRCRVTGGEDVLYSEPAELTVMSNIKAQPGDASVYYGDSAVFSVRAAGSDLSYQWQYRTSPTGSWKASASAGADTPSMSVSGTKARNGFQFRCRVTNGSSVTYSEPATLTTKSNVTTQPKDKSAYYGDRAVISVRAKGSAVQYQWQYYSRSKAAWYSVSGSSYDGANGPDLGVKATAARNGLRYRCKISNNGQVSYSDAVTLTTKSFITYQPWDAWVYPGDSAFFRLYASGSDLSFQWQYRSSETGKWINSGQSGANCSELSMTAKNARNGFQFRCKVTNGGITEYTEVVTLHLRQVISSQPKSVTGETGKTARFTVEVVEGFYPSYQWQYSTDGGATWKKCTLSGYDTNTLSVKITEARNGYMYRCKLVNNGEVVYSRAATLKNKG